MNKIVEILMRLKCSSADSAEKTKAAFLNITRENKAELEVLDKRLVFEFNEVWNKRKKKPAQKTFKAKRKWAPVKDALWYNEKERRYLFEKKLAVLYTSKRKAISDGWVFLGVITDRTLIRKFKYGGLRKGESFFAIKGRQELKYRTWQ